MYRSFRKQLSNEDIMSFTPPGFKYSIDVQFPRRCLPVCDSCKKKCKTREQCRARDCHTALPWIETYVCISLDNSCIGKDGKVLDAPFVANATKPIAFNLKGDVGPMTPVCAICREKSYTRGYCRRHKKHRQLPYGTVYVITSLKQDNVHDQGDAAIIPSSRKRSKNNAGESIIVDYIADIPVGVNTDDDTIVDDGGDDIKERREINAGESIIVDYIADMPVGVNTDGDTIADNDGDDIEDRDKETLKNPTTTNNDNDSKDEDRAVDESGSSGEKSGGNFQDLKDLEASKLDNIPRSRTFLVSVSSKLQRFEWVDIDPDVMTDLQMSHENKLNANDMSGRAIFNERGVNATGRTIGGVNNPETTMYISNNAGMPAARVRRLFANDGSTQPVMESQMVGSQIPRLGAQEMISHANLASQMEIRRRMGQMGELHQIGQIGQMHQMGVSNQRHMQIGRRNGANPFIAQTMMGEMPPYGVGVRDYPSPRDTMQYDPRVHLPSVRSRMTVPSVEFNQMGRRMGRQFGSRQQFIPGEANGIEVGSNVSGIRNVASGARSHRGGIVRHVSGRDMSTNMRNTEGDSAKDWTYGPSDNRMR